MILVYAFSNHWGTNISHRTLLELEKLFDKNSHSADFQLVYFQPKRFFEKNIKSFPPLSKGGQGGLVLGLGDGGKFLTKIKIETQAKNNYLDKPIQPFAPILLDLNLPPVDIYDSNFFKIGSNMGTYNCNWLAYQTQHYLNNYSPSTLHLFLHLPQKLPAPFLATKIFDLLHDNQII
ncbi:hypothetical protein KBC75_01725 [Candidatus Shapirobacteria bacterium]|nr:hypothetical protein [Candidatus Shapirobacteria bacterium]